MKQRVSFFITLSVLFMCKAGAVENLFQELGTLQTQLNALRDMLDKLPQPKKPPTPLSPAEEFINKIEAVETAVTTIQTRLPMLGIALNSSFTYDWQTAANSWEKKKDQEVKKKVEELTSAVMEQYKQLKDAMLLAQFTKLSSVYTPEINQNNKKQFISLLNKLQQIKTIFPNPFEQYKDRYKEIRLDMAVFSDARPDPWETMLDLSDEISTFYQTIDTLPVLLTPVIQKNDSKQLYNHLQTTIKKYNAYLKTNQTFKKIMNNLLKNLEANAKAQEDPSDVLKALRDKDETITNQLTALQTEIEILKIYLVLIPDKTLIDQWLAFIDTVQKNNEAVDSIVKALQNDFNKKKKNKTIKAYLEVQKKLGERIQEKLGERIQGTLEIRKENIQLIAKTTKQIKELFETH